MGIVMSGLVVGMAGCQPQNSADHISILADEVTVSKSYVYHSNPERYQPSYNLEGFLVPVDFAHVNTPYRGYELHFLVQEGDWATQNQPVATLKSHLPKSQLDPQLLAQLTTLLTHKNKQDSDPAVPSDFVSGQDEHEKPLAQKHPLQGHEHIEVQIDVTALKSQALNPFNPLRFVAYQCLATQYATHVEPDGFEPEAKPAKAELLPSSDGTDLSASPNTEPTHQSSVTPDSTHQSTANTPSANDVANINDMVAQNIWMSYVCLADADLYDSEYFAQTPEATLRSVPVLLTFTAPMAGEVTHLATGLTRGHRSVPEDTALMSIGDTTALQLIGELPLSAESNLTIGQSVNFTIANVDATLAGQISKIGISEDNHVIVEAPLIASGIGSGKTDVELESGMPARMSIEYGQMSLGVRVPRQAIYEADLSEFDAKHSHPISPVLGFVWVIKQDLHLAYTPVEVVQYFAQTDQFLVDGISNDSLICLADLPKNADGKRIIVEHGFW